jgi:hypothetical protein
MFNLILNKMKKYKLTDQNMNTYLGFHWELNKEQITSGNSDSLCNSHWLHYYHSPLLAVLLNPIHANISNPRLFEVNANGKHLNDKGLKGGCTKMTLIKEIQLPEISINQKITFAILCAKQVYKETNFILWADSWLVGKNRTAAHAAYAAYAAAHDAAHAAHAADAAADAADADAADINLIKIAKLAMSF